MGLFNKEKEMKKQCECGEGCQCGQNKVRIEEVNSVQILGGGCAKCNQLEANVTEAMEELGIVVEIEKVKDYAQIAAMGVMSTPAFAINGKVVSYGKVIKKEEIIKIFNDLKSC